MRGVRIKDHWKEQRLFDQRALVASAIGAILLLVLAGRLVLLQVVRFDYYAQQSQYNRVRVEPIPAARGLLLDRNGAMLAGGQPGYQLELVREEVPDLDRTLKGLVSIGLLTTEELPDIRRTILSRRSFDSVPIRLRMTDEDVGRFAVHRFDFPGVDIKSRQMRWYPNGALGVHALGYVSALSETDLQHIDAGAYAGTSVIGKLGVEAAYEKQLHGTNGFRQILVNAEGRSVEKIGTVAPQLRTQAPIAGETLVLGLDLKVQRVAEDALGEHRGAIVALDPRNGDIIALVSKPGFDPTEFARGITRAEYVALANDPDSPLLNRALRGTYPSGSTIKPAIGLVALTDHSITAEEKVLCNGTFELPHSVHIYRADKDEPRGMLDLTEAIAKSSDVYFYKLAHEMGIDKLDEGLAPFGYGQLTGIDISGEKPGLLPSPAWKKIAFKHPADQVWFPGETVNMGIGQGYLQVTPLQVAHIVGVIGERGRSFRPRLVIGTRAPDGRISVAAPVEEKPVTGISQEDWTTVIKAMMGTMTYGTGHIAFAKAAYSSAGKTGTAQLYTVAQNEKYNAKTVAENLRDDAWFVAFAPAEEPRIAIAVLAENAGFGAGTAAPIARTVIDAYLLGSDGKLKPEFEPSAQARARLEAARPAAAEAPAATVSQ
ncbi:MAG TPA: penicillin-binding protein 2 [Steroidobacteraceae bacterium]|jgi:penicillin-binding protein 2|nr:penicillin-binding protein 2 [Steroidobacteraceae bacterium]